MAKLDLRLHPVKTKIVCMWDRKEGLEFLYGIILTIAGDGKLKTYIFIQITIGNIGIR